MSPWTILGWILVFLFGAIALMLVIGFAAAVYDEVHDRRVRRRAAENRSALSDKVRGV